MKELTITPVTIKDLKEFIKTAKPSKAIAPKWFAARSFFKSEAAEKFTKELTEHLKDCKDCTELEADGFKIKLVTPQVNEYNDTPGLRAALQQVADIENALKLAKAEVELEQVRAGIKGKTDGNAYWKSV
ncbi:MAG TPA: hypothetical protein VGK47_07665 [Nitrososphaeraceae archaeon]